jgi:ferredoxin
VNVEAGGSVRYDALCARAESLGLAVRGAFHPVIREFEEQLPSTPAGTIILLGFTGGSQWDCYRSSAEARDGAPDPLDRWSRRVVGSLAREFGALDIYPNGTAPKFPFQRLAIRCEPVHRSPIGLLIHPQWGLWHAYRGALVLARRIELPSIARRVNPCERCDSKPCLSACPVDAFSADAFNLKACVAHLRSAAGSDCRDRGCLARRACPVAAEHRYADDQAAFHMEAFLRSAPV